MAQVPHADPGRVCPFHRLDMSEVCHRCPLWMQIRGKNPQTGADLDTWDCSFALLPPLLIEGSRQGRSTAAAVESFRNEMVNGQEQAARFVAAALNAPARDQKLLEG